VVRLSLYGDENRGIRQLPELGDLLGGGGVTFRFETPLRLTGTAVGQIACRQHRALHYALPAACCVRSMAVRCCVVPMLVQTMKNLQALSVLLLLLLVAACKPGAPGGAGSAGTAAAVPADDPAAVAALEQAGFSLKKNAAGNVTEVSVSADKDVAAALRQLAGLHSVTVARLGGPGLTDEAMQPLSSLTALKRLDLTDASGLGDGTLKIAAGLPNLEALILRRSGFTDDGLKHVKALKKLRAIDLRNTNATDAGIAHLEGMQSLADVQLEKSKVTDGCLKFLARLPLKSLNLNYNTEISDAAMPVITQIATLEQLQMEATRLTDTGLQDIGRLKNLKRFGCRLADVTGAGVAKLADCRELTRLELRETSLDDDGLKALKTLPKLTFLDISECRLVTVDGIPELAALTGLTYLELREIKKVRDESFAPLAALVNLTELNLEATRITSESVPVLLKFAKLERLHLAGTQLDDAGLVQLGQLPALKYLDISNLGATEETIAKLRGARPGLELKVN